MKLLVLLSLVSLALAQRVTFSNPDLILVVGQNDNLTAPAGKFAADAIAPMKQIQSWNDTQVYLFWVEARSWFASQFGILFAEGVNPFGFANSPYYAVSTDGRAALLPLVATGAYRVYGSIGVNVFPQLSSSDNSQPSATVQLVEYVVQFNLSNIPNWQFTPFNYGGQFAIDNGVPAPVEESDNLAFGIYKILGRNFYMRVPIPSKTSPVGFGTSRESAQLCNTLVGAGLSSMRVDAFASQPNSQDLYPTSTTAVWQFYRDLSQVARPELYAFAPKLYPGRSSASCLSSL